MVHETVQEFFNDSAAAALGWIQMKSHYYLPVCCRVWDALCTTKSSSSVVCGRDIYRLMSQCGDPWLLWGTLARLIGRRHAEHNGVVRIMTAVTRHIKLFREEGQACYNVLLCGSWSRRSIYACNEWCFQLLFFFLSVYDVLKSSSKWTTESRQNNCTRLQIICSRSQISNSNVLDENGRKP